MAHIVTNRGIYTLLSSSISGSTDIRAAVFVGGAPAEGTLRDFNFLSDLTAVMTEAAASGYARQDLASVTVTENDGSNTVTLTAAAPTIANVASGETWTSIAYYIHNASDNASVLLSLDTPSSQIVTSGSGITLPALNLTISQP